MAREVVRLSCDGSLVRVVQQFDSATKEGTGFLFDAYTAEALGTAYLFPASGIHGLHQVRVRTIPQRNDEAYARSGTL